MKRFLLTAMTLFLSLSLYSQNIINSQLNGNCTGNGFTLPSCVNGWNASHGTPTVKGEIGKNTWASLLANQSESQGIYTTYPFEIGQTYQITFQIKTKTNVSKKLGKKIQPVINIVSTSNLKPSFHSIKPQMNLEEIIWTKKIKDKKQENEWQTVSISFSPTQNNSQLWIYSSFKNNVEKKQAYQIEIEIDNISVQNQRKAILEDESIYTSNLKNSTFLFPNPLTKGETVNLNINTNVVSQLFLFDSLGVQKEIFYQIEDPEKISFALDTHLKEGIYLFHIKTKSNLIMSHKIIIQ